MHRRPWPIVFLALIQLFTPIGSVYFSAVANHVSFGRMFMALWNYAPFVDQLTIFYLPIILAALIYFTKRIGLYFVTASVLLTVFFNVLEWKKSNGSVSLGMLIAVSAVNLLLVAYLLLPSVREIFLNPSIRWWEHAPRYIVNWPATVLKNESDKKCHLNDVSIGGASLEMAPGNIARGDIVYLKFQFQERIFGMQCEVMYERSVSPEYSKYGLRRLAGAMTGETLSIQGLIDDLKKAKYPVTRPEADVKKSLVEWMKKASTSPKAWVPETPVKRASTPPSSNETKS